MTPVSNFLSVLLTLLKLSKIVKVSLTGVVDTGEKLLTGVNDTGNACFAGVVDAGEHRNSRISLRIIEKNHNRFWACLLGTGGTVL